MVRCLWNRATRLAWCLAVAAAAAPAGGETMALATVPETGIDVQIDGWAGLAPHNTSGRDAGLVPIVVTITNRSQSDRVWTIEPDGRFGGGTATTMPVAHVAVPAGDSVKATLYADPGKADSFGTAWMKVRGFGLPGGEQSFHVESRTPSGAALTTLPSAISRDAFSKRGAGLDGYFIPGGLGLDLNAAPDDWRGWSAFSAIIMTESEWLAMSAGQRKALLDWVGLGRVVGLLVADPSPSRLDAIGLPPAVPDGNRWVGAGAIRPLPWNGEAIDAVTVERFLDGRREHPRSDQLGDYATTAGGMTTWAGGFEKLFAVFGPRQLPAAAILAFLAVFGSIAGPLNVLVLAGPRRRSRVFWTTPLISVVATVLLLSLMFLQDGVGGTGARRVLGLLMPDRNGMAVIQEQFSRTGVLLSSTFPMLEPSWMRPLGNADGGKIFLEVDGRTREGDWFRSRSDQAYLIETVRPSRAKIELLFAGDDPPSVISSIEVPLDRVFIIDDAGRFWTTTDLGTGERRKLEHSDANAYAAWFDAVSADAGPIRRSALDAVRNRSGHAYAASRRAAPVAVRTLGSLRFSTDEAVFAGPFTRSTAR